MSREALGWQTGAEDPEKEGVEPIRKIEWAYRKQASTSDWVRRQSHEDILQVERAATLGLMVGTVVHEANNFLTAIMGSARLLEMSDSDPSRLEYYGNIVRMTERIRDLLQGIGDFPRKSAPPHTLMDVRRPIQRAVALVENLLVTSGIRLIRAFRPDLPPVRGDADQLEQVFLNLCQNAIQAMGGGGSLTLSADLEDGEVVVTVVDTGCGIPGEHVDRIFDAFFTTKPTGQGTGLGLAICRRIIREHRGEIRVESEPGIGTRFTIRLPAAQDGPASSPDLFFET